MEEAQLKEYQQLRSLGVWPEASKYRNEERLRLRREGKPKKVAAAESWELMREKYLAPAPAVMMSRVQAMVMRARAAP